MTLSSAEILRLAEVLEGPSIASLKAHIKTISAPAESSLFAYQARLAHALGLLTPLVAGHEAEVRRVSDELISILSADHFPRHQPVQNLLHVVADRRDVLATITPEVTAALKAKSQRNNQ